MLMMIGMAQYWTRVGVLVACAAAISLDSFHQRIVARQRALFSR
jgi:hypothetical protein